MIQQTVLEVKRCPKCGCEKPLSDFSKANKSRDKFGGIQGYCKQCAAIDKMRRNLVLLNREDIPKLPTKYCPKCKTEQDRVMFSVSKSVPDGLQSWCKRCVADLNKSKRKDRAKRKREKTKSNIYFRMELAIRARIKNAIINGTKSAKTMVLLGMHGAECFKYLENLFWPGMCKKNYGRYGWVIDHIIPIASFDKNDPNWQYKCFHYTNLQPLWHDDNHVKRDKLDWTPAESKHELPERLRCFTTTV
jgi:hypothetical protein